MSKLVWQCILMVLVLVGGGGLLVWGILSNSKLLAIGGIVVVVSGIVGSADRLAEVRFRRQISRKAAALGTSVEFCD